MKLKIEYLPTNTLMAYEANARVHSDAQLAQLEASIAQFGFNVPVLVRSDLTLVAGHGRVEAAKRLGLAEVPVIRIEHLTEEQVRAFTLADNKIALNAGWDFEKLSAELNDLVQAGFDLAATGFDENELNSLLAEAASILPDDFDSHPDMIQPIQYSRADPSTAPEYAEQQAEVAPRASHDEYSNFALIMLHKNKLELLEILTNIRQAHGYAKLEQALMHMAYAYQDPN